MAAHKPYFNEAGDRVTSVELRPAERRACLIIDAIGEGDGDKSPACP